MKNLLTKSLIVAAFVGVASTASAVTFQSPSGNIICSSDSGGVLCHISQKNSSRAIRPVPRDCGGDWGNDFYVGRTGRAELACVSDWVHSANAQVVAYGKTIKGNGWSCTSQKSGMTCKNNAGRGFSISRASQRIF